MIHAAIVQPPNSIHFELAGVVDTVTQIVRTNVLNLTFNPENGMWTFEADAHPTVHTAIISAVAALAMGFRHLRGLRENC